jgi:fructose-1-phosphate kinase PfkB-like protein
LDVRGPELLEALKCRPLLVKPNREELVYTFGLHDPDEATLLRTMHKLNERGAEWVVVTDGARALRITHDGESLSLTPPKVEKVVNPIGCGDCLTAGIAEALQQNRDVIDAIRWGMACAADNLGQIEPARIERQRAEAILASC